MAVPSIEAIAKSAARRLTPSSVSETIQPQLFGEDQLAIAYLEDHLNIAFNAVLYSTSAGVESRSVPAWRPTRRRRRQPLGSAGQVFYLPGKITIRHGHRTDGDPPEPSGRKLTRRVLVRGHWRRANPLWVDQRLRWVEPHFRGPDMAALIEREYQLAPQKQDESEVPP